MITASISKFPAIVPSRFSFFRSAAASSAMSESDRSSPFAAPRLVLKKILAKLQHEGDGAVVRRGIGRTDLKNLDPFLMLDDFSGWQHKVTL
ncbi:pirin-like protein [Momordica charantia]|uniref:Pirin-like protein n=1 Tax=Momordica charantia TaxID=3673 RepID=A0A6J1C8Y9_MOMCH|nr:pirin-like protein [Momordica charantia]